MKILSLILICILIGTSFQTNNAVQLAFKNDSSDDFQKLTVNIRGNIYHFLNLPAGKTTKPIHVENTYKYCYAKAITAKDTLICQPVDFVGETLVTSGKLQMTFQIISESNGKRYLVIK
ncbi:MAG: hypothetical protein ABUL44_02785 [Flavobacterium sp.]